VYSLNKGQVVDSHFEGLSRNQADDTEQLRTAPTKYQMPFRRKVTSSATHIISTIHRVTKV